ncbi:MAG TPA: amidohydrolase family protein [Lacunisphaera sp.]|jgi:L-fuconolactonase|nr:amidohydrolase family protein [Lacunisphaera sp.]
MRIDAHQHFWHYSADDYGWIDDTMRVIRRDFLPSDLAPLLATARIDGTVAVQARQTIAETDWLLGLAESSPLIKGVVGWVPLAREGAAVGALLDRYQERSRFKGVRHVLQAESEAYFAGPEFNAALDEVARRGLVYDLLIFSRQLPVALELVHRHPSLRIVLDHIAKPLVQGPPSADWRTRIRELARRPNVACKFSGVVTEVPGWQWTPELLRPYFDVVLDAFGPHRLIFGSDWPVCLVAADYARWVALVDEFTAPLAAAERAAILGGTATSVYRLAS